jgi:SAM-dependent methyltransferase
MSRLASISKAAWRVVTDDAYRAYLAFRLFPRSGTFQRANFTASNRYPTVFGAVQSELQSIPTPQLLSFGCSIGDEVLTLRSYFPSARIKGLDVNPHNIAVCRRRVPAQSDPDVAFAVANSTKDEPTEHYDAIFCMAVLQDGRLRPAGVPRSDPLLYFSDVDDAVADLYRCLRPGGLLAICHSNFRVRDTRVGPLLDPIFAVSVPDAAVTPKFGTDNRRLDGTVYCDAVFRKRSPTAQGD